MMEQTKRPARQVGIADHLWETFELMAEQMGSEREALINQALFTFARLNGFLEAASAAPRSSAGAAAAAVPRTPAFAPAPAPVRHAPLQHPKTAPGLPAAEAAPAAEDERSHREEDGALPLPGAAEPAAASIEPDAAPVQLPAPAAAAAEPGLQLYLMTESGELDKITKDRFVIGRGKHCDFVINSGKVSREHAVIVRDGDAYFIEDLGSSNGTWFNKQRIKRRRVEEGDEYFVCNEKIKLVLR
ncbi:FHA domain-containing protein [Aggregicoccus sp. 17bor-14]|uniref:FHA domain-containing protein n=1 Tax=Myxococcaceae TaxID=31 RepID=UPI00129C54BD|nr:MULTISPECIES: FHA domain-containing protein [Myxococcaceae]MBF5041161.1 FHA domain-containing protein [Simulacricoccus sp. 17bor-14]MRI86948.1 FHA domain-containing protein [Aggregicoccus sp. 17bor-14]